MGRGPCLFKKADVTRVLEAVDKAVKAGVWIERVEIVAGKIVIFPQRHGEEEGQDNASGEWDNI
jgi:hypothetical protein